MQEKVFFKPFGEVRCHHQHWKRSATHMMGFLQIIGFG